MNTKTRIENTIADLYYDGISKKHIIKTLKQITEDLIKGGE